MNKLIVLLASALMIGSVLPIAGAHWGTDRPRHFGGLLGADGSKEDQAHIAIGDEGASASYWGSRPCYDTIGIDDVDGDVNIPDDNPDPAIGDAQTTDCHAYGGPGGAKSDDGCGNVLEVIPHQGNGCTQKRSTAPPL